MTLVISKQQLSNESFYKRRTNAEIGGGEPYNFEQDDSCHAFFASSHLRPCAPLVNLMVFNSATVSSC